MPSLSIGARRKLALPVAALAAATALVGAFVPASFADDGGAGAAPAPINSVPYDPNGSYTCVGTTESLTADWNPDDFTAPPTPNAPQPSNPATVTVGAGGENLTQLFGNRITDLEAGHVVPLYANQGDNANTPAACALRLVTDATSGERTAVAEWIYCTDQTNPACVSTDEDGRLNEAGTFPGAQEELEDGNPRLSPEQQQVISYLIQNDFDLPLVPAEYAAWVESTISSPQGDGYRSSNDNSTDRQVRQLLVWCVSDYAGGNYTADPGNSRRHIQGWCKSLGLEEGGSGFNAILDIMNATPDVAVSLTDPATGDVQPGGTASFSITTATPGVPVSLVASSGTLEIVSPATATLNAGVLTYPEGEDTAVVRVTGADAGELTLSASSTVPRTGNVMWSQSPQEIVSQDKFCQVFATTAALGPVVVSGEASVKVLEENGAAADADANGADADTNGANADTNGANADTNGADADANGADADANGADAGTNGADADANGANADTNGANADTNGADADTNGADADANGADADANGADAGTNGADADANGANADTNGADADTNGANAGTNGADAQGNNAQGAASAKASAQASASAQGGNAQGDNAQGAANGAKGGLAATGAASPLIAGTAALLLVAAGAGALAMRRRSAR
ncbi:hypothetical protein ACXR2T_06225 [Leucobacter sp. HY1910]